jgi:uncharacterized protein YgbK (DUF1537 family)
VLADALDDHDLDLLAAGVADLADERPVLFGGAAGFAAALARAWPTGRAAGDAGDALRATGGRALVISGSCSARTREQVARFPGPRVDLDAVALAADAAGAVTAVLDRLVGAWGDGDGDGPVLVSSSAGPDAVRATQDRLGAQRAAAVLEEAAGAVAARAVRDLGVRRLLVAGGETSGAVASALGLRVLRVGPAAAPGVPWMVPVGGPAVAVLLKSGNFGGPDLFTTAWEACP